MSKEEVQNPASGGAGEAIEPTEPQAPAAEPTTPQEPPAPAAEPANPSGDPLDDIRDPVARAEAKKYRAIARRKDEPAPSAPPAPSQPAAPAADKTVTFLAKQAVSDEVREHWDELLSIPLAGYDATDPASIAANMTARLAVFKAQPQKPANPARDLAADTGTRGRTTGGTPPTEKKSAIPRPLDVDAKAKQLYG